MQNSHDTFADECPFPDIDDLPINESLPDPLVMRDGTRAATVAEWESKRKPELKALLQHYMYGFAPAAPLPISATVRHVDPTLFGGLATLKQVSITVGPDGCPPIELMLIIPKTTAAVWRPPVVLGLNFGGNHTVLPGTSIFLRPGATEEDRGKAIDAWGVYVLGARGYALATFYTGDVAPDKPDFTGGVFPFFDESVGEERSPIAWGVIAAWAWGLQRAVDYLMTDGDIDAKRIVLYGHSRNGKAALLSGAFDDRVAAVIAHQAGCGGSAPSRCRVTDAETVAKITSRFPAWFNGIFPQFGGREDSLPFDQNCLTALYAPRPVLFSAGTRDRWCDPEGQFEVLKAANPAYRLYGAAGLPDDVAAPEMNRRVGKELSYYIQEAGHMIDEAYWEAFMDFADGIFGKR